MRATLGTVSSRIRLSLVNDVLLGLIILINGYVILAPQFPKLQFWWDDHLTDTKQVLTDQIKTAKNQNLSTQANTLIVPAMFLDTPVLEAPIKETYRILDQGIWRWPLGSTPDKGGNTVLIGHRFTYTNPKGLFYSMDRLRKGDIIGITWSNKMYTYKVSNIREVAPTETSITDPSDDSKLTLYTCTPLWNPINRLVVTASLESPR